jgi:hypothetical protein
MTTAPVKHLPVRGNAELFLARFELLVTPTRIELVFSP